MNNTLVQNDIVSEEGIYSIALVNDNGLLMAYVYNRELEDAMFTKLYIFKGQGLNQFKLAHEELNCTSLELLVYKVVIKP